MSFADLVNKSWEDGKKGTEKVNIKEGMDTVFSIADAAIEQQQQRLRAKDQKGIEK